MTMNEDLQRLVSVLAPFLEEARQQGHSMATMDIDLVKLFGLPYHGKELRMVIALAIGPSAPVLSQAIEMAQNPH
jgi:hypothetical protein